MKPHLMGADFDIEYVQSLHRKRTGARQSRGILSQSG